MHSEEETSADEIVVEGLMAEVSFQLRPER